MIQTKHRLLLVGLAFALGACSSSSGGTGGTTDGGPTRVDSGVDATTSYSVSVVVSGVTGTGLVLQNGADTLSIPSDNTYTFATPVQTGSRYNVTVQTPPSSPSETCTVTNGSDIMGTAPVTNIVVTCSVSTYTVGGTVTGLTGIGLVLQDNTTNNLVVTAPGTFAFTQALANGSPFTVSVLAQPTNPTQFCSVTGASSTITGANYTGAMVTCVNANLSVGGTVTGLQTFASTDAGFVGATTLGDSGIGDSGIPTSFTSLILTNAPTGEALPVSANGSFTFTFLVNGGSPYSVSVTQQPSGQFCQVTSGASTVGSTSVTTIGVSCTTVTSCAQLLALNPTATSGYTYVYPTTATGTSDGGTTTDAGTSLLAPIPVLCHMGSNPSTLDTTSNPTAGWTLVFNQDFTISPNVTSIAAWALVNPTLPSIGQYSIVKYLAQMKSQTNYEFYLTWPRASVGATAYPTGSVWWQQFQNPTSTALTASNPPLVSKLMENPPSQVGSATFMGLNPVSGSAMLSGEVNGNFWWSIGLPSAWSGVGIPAYSQYTPDGGTATSAPSGGATVQVQLWLK